MKSISPEFLNFSKVAVLSEWSLQFELDCLSDLWTFFFALHDQHIPTCPLSLLCWCLGVYGQVDKWQSLLEICGWFDQSNYQKTNTLNCEGVLFGPKGLILATSNAQFRRREGYVTLSPNEATFTRVYFSLSQPLKVKMWPYIQWNSVLTNKFLTAASCPKRDFYTTPLPPTPIPP